MGDIMTEYEQELVDKAHAALKLDSMVKRVHTIQKLLHEADDKSARYVINDPVIVQWIRDNSEAIFSLAME